MVEVTLKNETILGFGLPEDALDWFHIPKEKVNRIDSETGFEMPFQEAVFWTLIAQPNVKKGFNSISTLKKTRQTPSLFIIQD